MRNTLWSGCRRLDQVPEGPRLLSMQSSGCSSPTPPGGQRSDLKVSSSRTLSETVCLSVPTWIQPEDLLTGSSFPTGAGLSNRSDYRIRGLGALSTQRAAWVDNINLTVLYVLMQTDRHTHNRRSNVYGHPITKLVSSTLFLILALRSDFFIVIEPKI